MSSRSSSFEPGRSSGSSEVSLGCVGFKAGGIGWRGGSGGAERARPTPVTRSIRLGTRPFGFVTASPADGSNWHCRLCQRYRTSQAGIRRLWRYKGAVAERCSFSRCRRGRRRFVLESRPVRAGHPGCGVLCQHRLRVAATGCFAERWCRHGFTIAHQTDGGRDWRQGFGVDPGGDDRNPHFSRTRSRQKSSRR